MKKLLLITSALAVTLPLFAQSTYPLYIAGDFNGWNAAGNVMAETYSGSGIWSVTLTGVAAGRHEFKVTEGAWSWNYPGANSWLYAPASGIITITYDQNTYADGWSAASQRIGLDADPGTWTAAGSFQGWNNADPGTAMTPLGGGIYQYTLTTVGTWDWKAVVTGSWDSISWDNRSVGTANWNFTINPGEAANLYVNALTGVAKVDIVTVPEPSTMALGALSGFAMLMVARKRK
jgi:hypothetical protein